MELLRRAVVPEVGGDPETQVIDSTLLDSNSERMCSSQRSDIAC
jgi:hypothetical protein